MGAESEVVQGLERNEEFWLDDPQRSVDPLSEVEEWWVPPDHEGLLQYGRAAGPARK
jgi:hypothetical protein